MEKLGGRAKLLICLKLYEFTRIIRINSCNSRQMIKFLEKIVLKNLRVLIFNVSLRRNQNGSVVQRIE